MHNTQGRNKDGTHVEQLSENNPVKMRGITAARAIRSYVVARRAIINYVDHCNGTFANNKKNVHSFLLLSLLFPARRDRFQVIEHVRAFIETFVTLMGNAIRHVTR